MIDFRNSLELAVAVGENRFTMTRGSFSYKQKTGKPVRLTREHTVRTEDGVAIAYAGTSPEERYTLFVSEEAGGRLKARLAYAGIAEKMPHNRFFVSFPADPDEHIYGCGETYSAFDLKGESVRIFVAEHQNSDRIGKKMIREKLLGKDPDRILPFDRYESYYAQPTFVSSRKYFVHADVTGYAEFDFREPGRTTLVFQELPTLYTDTAETFPELSEKLSALLGRQPVLPDWIYGGAIVAVQGGTDVIDAKLAAAKEAGAKICGVWSQDWCGCRRTGFGYQVMWNWEWDRDLYPRLDEKIAEWKAAGVRFLGYINPFLAIEKDLYRTAHERGYCVKTKDGEDYLVTITTFPAAMIDLTNPDAYDWYKDIIKTNLIGLGLGGWMADFGEYLPVDCVLASGEDPAFVHNTWPAVWARLNREAIAECGKENDVFFFTRAGHTGTIAASTMMWTGDQHVDWSRDDGLPSVIPATLSLAMSGFGVTHSDAGGYTTIMHMTRPKELLLRWEEMNVFSPLYRFHEGNQPARNVQFDGDADLLAQLARTSRLHAALKPYLKNCVAECAERGIPVMRPLFYHYDEPFAYTETTEYLLGRDLLVAPVLTEGAKERVVRFPEGRWIHLFTGREYVGGSITVEAPVGRPPVFVRKESPRLEELLALGRIE